MNLTDAIDNGFNPTEDYTPAPMDEATARAWYAERGLDFPDHFGTVGEPPF